MCLEEQQQIPIYSLWFDPIGAQTHDLPHWRRGTITPQELIDHVNEVKVRWQTPGWHVSSMINVWTNYSEYRFGLVFLVFNATFNHISVISWQINGNEETDLINEKLSYYLYLTLLNVEVLPVSNFVLKYYLYLTLLNVEVLPVSNFVKCWSITCI